MEFRSEVNPSHHPYSEYVEVRFTKGFELGDELSFGKVCSGLTRLSGLAVNDDLPVALIGDYFFGVIELFGVFWQLFRQSHKVLKASFTCIGTV